jgi:DNA-binding GntR family transcriptional regulator
MNVTTIGTFDAASKGRSTYEEDPLIVRIISQRFQLVSRSNVRPLTLHKALAKTIDTMEKVRENDDTLAYANADTRFHNAFFDHCGNHFFVEAYDIVAGRIAALRAHMSAQLGLHRQKTFQEHLEMLSAVERRDRDALQRTLRDHIAEMEPNYANALQLV